MVYESDSHTKRRPEAAALRRHRRERRSAGYDNTLVTVNVGKKRNKSGATERAAKRRSARSGAGLSVELGGDDTLPPGITRRQHGANRSTAPGLLRQPLNEKETTGSN